MYENDNYVDFKFEVVEGEQVYQAPQAPVEYPKKKKKRGLAIVATALSCALVGGICGGTAVYYMQGSDAPATTSLAEVAEIVEPEVAPVVPVASTYTLSEGGTLKTPVEIYEENVGAVVGITTSITTNAFGQTVEYAASGTGFVITEDGYIVTNNHVVEGATTVEVVLYDGTAYEAEIIGTESINTDVALLKVEATGLQTVTIGDSDNIAVGEQVAAIGNPLGELTFTQTVGYISAMDREINTDGTPVNMLQTDVAINSGNSGGPLFDMYGNVIGVTTAKYSGSSGSGASIEGIGFALPINDVVDIVNDLREYGYVTGKAYLGVGVQELDGQTARYYNLPSGVYISSVTEGSCAETAGIEVGDIIIGLGGEETPDYASLTGVLYDFEAGETTEVIVYRSGQELTLSITFDEKAPVTE